MFNELPYIKVELKNFYTENQIDYIIDEVLNNSKLFKSPIVRINRGIKFTCPTREITFSKSELNMIEIKYSTLHFDEEREGLDIFELIKFINNLSSNNLLNNSNVINVKLNKPLKKHNLNAVINYVVNEMNNSTFCGKIIQKNNGFINNNFPYMYVEFVESGKNVIEYIKFNTQDKVIIDNKEEEYINNILGYIYYSNHK